MNCPRSRMISTSALGCRSFGRAGIGTQGLCSRVSRIGMHTFIKKMKGIEGFRTCRLELAGDFVWAARRGLLGQRNFDLSWRMEWIRHCEGWD